MSWLKQDFDRSEGFPARDISSLHAMGSGSGQIEKLSARRRRRRRHLILPGGAAALPRPPLKSAYRPPGFTGWFD